LTASAPARVEAVTVRNSRRVAMTTSGVSERPEIWVDATLCEGADAVKAPPLAFLDFIRCHFLQ